MGALETGGCSYKGYNSCTCSNELKLHALAYGVGNECSLGW